LVRDPEIKEFGEGKKVANFSLAVNGWDKDKEADFIPITAWDKTAEIVEVWCKQGSRVAIKGRFQLQCWEKDGQKRSKIQVICESLSLLSNKKQESAEPAASVSGGGDPDNPF
jgi:single-strand DNA-binding protein